MKNISPPPGFEETKSIIEKYKLPDFSPNNHLFEDLLEIVFENCKHLIPEELSDYFWRSDQYDAFANDIKTHLIISWLLTDTFYNNPQFLDSNHNLCKKMIKILEPIENNQGFYPKRDPSNYMKVLSTHVSPHLKLSMSKRKSKNYDIKAAANKLTKHVDIPIIAGPFVIFLANYYDLIKVIEGSRDISNDDNKKINMRNVVEFLATCLTNYVEVLDKLEEYKAYQVFNLHLFEREFDLILISKIERITQNLQEFIKDEAIKVLSLVSLLPNTFGRIKYVDMLFSDPCPAKISFLKTTVSSEWLSVLSNIFLKMAYVTIPVMEKYFYHLMGSSELSISPNTLKLKNPLTQIFSKPYSDVDTSELLKLIGNITLIKGTSMNERIDLLLLGIFNNKAPEDKCDQFEQIILEADPKNASMEIINIAKEKLFTKLTSLSK